ncbi:type 1 glutamine amidotransferase [Micrococcoides hystricis]|uniref:Lipid II isoglutaminyl synthase (glutamine-hydrolyzing) subunit GatD n=1 Tax=Micrococcoides hystricis TaxID=1572761 RepID=A0ABV6P932_9MICC
MSTSLTICQLYPQHLNMYGDWGNTLVLKRRAEAMGVNVTIIDHDLGSPADLSTADLIVGGGGQDSGQLQVHDDLLSQASTLRNLAEDGVPMLMVCGMYQLFGQSFEASSGEVLPGIGIFDAVSTNGKDRLIGNIAVETEDFGTIYGYENHVGRTTLRSGTVPLGKTSKGCGNNGEDGTEGARNHHVFGTYLHGSLLPKNPKFADYLIDTALTRTNKDWEPVVVEDEELIELTENARRVAAGRPR